MKTSELRDKDVAGVRKELGEVQTAYFKLRIQKATNQLANTASLKVARRNIARAKTILTEKQNKGAAK